MKFGDIIKAARLEQRWTQKMLADKADVSQPDIVRIERYTKEPSFRIGMRLLNILGLDVNEVHEILENQDN